MDHRRFDRKRGIAHRGAGEPVDDTDAFLRALFSEYGCTKYLLYFSGTNRNIFSCFREEFDHRTSDNSVELLVEVSDAGFSRILLGISFDSLHSMKLVGSNKFKTREVLINPLQYLASRSMVLSNRLNGSKERALTYYLQQPGTLKVLLETPRNRL